MKKMIIILLLVGFNIMLFSQTKDNSKDKINTNKFRKLKSNVEIKETVVIRKPDITNILKRKETTEVYDLKVDIQEKIRNSNKLLY
jgi:hypothetical protein